VESAPFTIITWDLYPLNNFAFATTGGTQNQSILIGFDESQPFTLGANFLCARRDKTSARAFFAQNLIEPS
jgi:hypothetical protein